MNEDLNAMFEGMAGQRIPGGCEDCDAYQITTGTNGFYLTHVHHDDWCPTYNALPASS